MSKIVDNMESELSFKNDVTELMAATRSCLGDLELIPRQTSPADATLLALLSKSIVLTEAIALLVQGGYGDEALGLCRTAVEVRLIVRYLTNSDTAKRSWRYQEYFAKANLEWQRLIKKYYPDLTLEPRADAEAIEKLAAKYPDPNKWSAENHGLKYFAMEPSSFESREDGSPLTDGFCHEVLYKWMSYYVHAVQPSLEGHVTLPGDRFQICSGSPRSNRGDQALRTSFLCVHLNIHRIMRCFNMSYPEDLKARYEAAMHKYKDGPQTKS